MKKTLKPETTKPQYVVTTDITYAQVDSWFGHCRRDLKLDLIPPQDGAGTIFFIKMPPSRDSALSKQSEV